MAAIHKRFDEGSDEDGELPVAKSIGQTNESATNGGDVSESGDDDDDAAPEAVTTSAAISASKDAQRKIARTVRQAEEQGKTRRKRLDASRVKQTRSRRKALADTGVAGREEPEEVQEGSDKKGSGNAASLGQENSEEEFDDDEDGPGVFEIPTLPAEVIAAAERANRMSKPPVPKRQHPATNKRKRKFIDADPKPIKDVRVGSTTIRVLEKASSTLPPKAAPRGSNAREAWLANRQGNAGTSGRKPWKSSFVKG